MLTRYALHTQLMGMALVVAVLALGLAGSTLFFLDREQARKTLIEEMRSLAELVANRSAAALVFKDDGTARENLAALAGVRHIGAACLFSPDGQVFSSYRRRAVSPTNGLGPEACTVMGSAQDFRQSADDGVFKVQVAVRSGHDIVGALQVSSIADPLAERLRSQLVSLGVALFGALLVTVMVALKLERAISGPISRVRDVATAILDSGNYQLRAPDLGPHEIGKLAQAFNATLEQITTLNTELETRVAARTQELAQSNAALQSTLDTLRRAQDDLLQRDKLASLGALVAGVAHELNTPLGNSVTVASTLVLLVEPLKTQLEQGTLRKSKAVDALDQMQQCALLLQRNLERAVQLIVHFKQVAVDQTSEHRRSFDLASVVSDVVETLQPQFKHTHHRVEVDIPGGIVMDSYPGPLGQVVTNLVLNAMIHGFAAEHVGVVRIEAQQVTPGEVSLRVVDNGVGIPAKHLSRIFDPFFTTRMGLGGSGLGLHIVHNIVMVMLGGTIRVSSTLGEGAQFTVVLPQCAPEPTKTHQPGVFASTQGPE